MYKYAHSGLICSHLSIDHFSLFPTLANLIIMADKTRDDKSLLLAERRLGWVFKHGFGKSGRHFMKKERVPGFSDLYDKIEAAKEKVKSMSDAQFHEDHVLKFMADETSEEVGPDIWLDNGNSPNSSEWHPNADIDTCSGHYPENLRWSAPSERQQYVRSHSIAFLVWLTLVLFSTGFRNCFATGSGSSSPKRERTTSRKGRHANPQLPMEANPDSTSGQDNPSRTMSFILVQHQLRT